jgi:four helix bundle protein
MVSADRFEDLLTWRLLYELSLEVWKFTGEQSVRQNFKYCDQIRDSSDSAHRNVAEGFGRYNPTEFARFLDISRGSAEETRALLKTAHAKHFLSDEQFTALKRVAVRGLQALAKLQRYVRSPEAKRNAQRWRHSRERCRVPQPPGQSNSIESTQTNDSNGSNDSNDPL